MSSSFFQEKIFNHVDAAMGMVGNWKKNKETLVFTNGCFDILHKGHVSYLEKAAQHGTKLILGLNSDSSVRTLNKSPNRPLQSQESRSYVMAALSFVDAVVIFDEPTPLQIIKQICPDVLVKGADYEIADIVGAKEVLDNGGKVETIALEQGFSTSSIEQKILENKH